MPGMIWVAHRIPLCIGLATTRPFFAEIQPDCKRTAAIWPGLSIETEAVPVYRKDWLEDDAMELGRDVIWISHRGYHQDCTDNTKKAFDAALLGGFQHLEIDLRSTSDGHIVLHHDATLLRTCGQNRAVDSMRLKEWRELQTIDHQKLLSFEEFMQSYAGCSWIFDIKPESGLRTLHLLKQWSQRKKAESWLNAQARFNLHNQASERLASVLFPEIPRLASERACYRAGVAVLFRLGGLSGIEQGRTYSLPRYFLGTDLFNSRMVQAYHRRGARVLAYLPEQDHDVKAAISAGFDEIMTNGLPPARPFSRESL